MYFCGKYEEESFLVHPMDDLDSTHFISIIKAKEEPIFSVTCCCDDEWVWDFWYSSSNYERVKWFIMDAIFNSETMDELIDVLDDAFAEYCEEMVAYDDECDCDCDCDCENCIQH